MTNQREISRILFIDLDDTFLQTDMLYESFIYCFLRNPAIVLLCLYWLLSGGKTLLKTKLAKRFKFDPSLLPVNISILNIIKEKKLSGYSIYLISASVTDIVESIYNYYSEYFDGYFATDICTSRMEKRKINLQGVNKANFIKTKFTNSYKEYVGNSRSDIAVWRICDKGYAVSHDEKFSSELKLEYLKPNVRTKKYKLILKQLRVHQWVKNSLIFLPLIATHKLLPLISYFDTFWGFLGFCFISSSVYVTNDLFDLENDRGHENKRKRPLASGDLSIKFGILLQLLTFVIGSIISMSISIAFYLLVICYFIINILYSSYIKKIIIFDCILLSMMYTYRIFIGTLVANLDISVWLLSFTFFLFLSLAFIKRYSELFNLQKNNKVIVRGRGYIVIDMPVIIGMAIGSGFLSVLVLDIYLNSEEVKNTFQTIWFAYFCLPILLYWLSRIFIKATRGDLIEDPVLYAIKDKTSIYLGLLFITFFWGAALF